MSSNKLIVFACAVSSVMACPVSSVMATDELPSMATNDLPSMATDDLPSFLSFIKKFDKTYKSMDHLKERFSIYSSNLKVIHSHNTCTESVCLPINYTLGETFFTDFSQEEFKLYHNLQVVKSPLTAAKCSAFKSPNAKIPTSIDWRQQNAVSPVKDQGQCGSCWAFSSTGSMEGAWSIATGNLISLSEQQLVDCSYGLKYGNLGCNGGEMDAAFQYAIDSGMCGEDDYTYAAKKGECHSCSCSALVHFKSCVDVTPNNEANLAQAVAMNPVSVAIEADTQVFQLYKSGVITSSACGTSLDHGVLVVGYGAENGIDYWLVKNSWGEGWGEDGYVKIEKTSSTNSKGVCGIAMQPSYPVV